MKEEIRCAVIDDEPLALELMAGYVSQTPGFTVTNKFTNAIDAIAFLKTEEIDLLFLDIQMPVLTGLDLVKVLPNPPAIIFTTAYREYAVESYEHNAIDYMVKPITYLRFLKAINKYQSLHNSPTSSRDTSALSNTVYKAKQESYIYVNVNKKYVKVAFEDILYVESLKDYIKIYTSKDEVSTKFTLSEFYDRLPSYFIRVHRSFIVNKHKITAFTHQDIEINSKELPIGKSYKEEVMNFLNT